MEIEIGQFSSCTADMRKVSFPAYLSLLQRFQAVLYTFVCVYSKNYVPAQRQNHTFNHKIEPHATW